MNRYSISFTRCEPDSCFLIEIDYPLNFPGVSILHCGSQTQSRSTAGTSVSHADARFNGSVPVRSLSDFGFRTLQVEGVRAGGSGLVRSHGKLRSLLPNAQKSRTPISPVAPWRQDEHAGPPSPEILRDKTLDACLTDSRANCRSPRAAAPAPCSASRCPHEALQAAYPAELPESAAALEAADRSR